MRSDRGTHAVRLERARAERAPYHEAARLTRLGGIKFAWLYSIGWPAVLSLLYGLPALLSGDKHDGAPAVALGLAWGVLTAVVVLFVTTPVRRAGALLETFAGRVSGIAFTSPRPDRILAWLDGHWADDAPRSIIHDPLGTAYFVGVEATYRNAPCLIIGVRPHFKPGVHAVILLSAPHPRPASDQARVALGELGYAASVTGSGILLSRTRATVDAFSSAELDRVLELASELAGLEPNGQSGASAELRAKLCALALERWKPILHFDERELSENARGRLSARQRFESGAHAAGWTVLALFAGGLGCSGLAGGLRDRRSPTSAFGANVGYALFELLALVLVFFAGRAWLDALDGHAALVFGPLRHSTSAGYKGGVRHWLSCGGQRFAVAAAAAYAVEAGVMYRVYYGVRTHRLLSLEPASRAPE